MATEEDDSSSSLPLAKRSRQDDALALTVTAAEEPRRRTLLEHPSFLLDGGHASSVTGVAFSHDGARLATCSRDRSVGIWDLRQQCANTLSIRGHKNGVLAVVWLPLAHGDMLATASADKTGGVWDAESGTRVKTLAGHTKIVNDISAARGGAGAPPLLVTASDDCTAKVWDARSRHVVLTITERFPLLCCAFGGDGGSVFVSGIEGRIRQHDLRKGGAAPPLLTLEGVHTEAVTGLSLSPDGTHLLSFGCDNRLCAWDVQPFAAAAASGGGPGGRCVRTFVGATQNFEMNLLRCAWSADGDVVAAGSADKRACLWDFASGGVRALGGHAGVVSAVAFSPTEPVFASGGTDKKVWVSEL